MTDSGVDRECRKKPGVLRGVEWILLRIVSAFYRVYIRSLNPALHAGGGDETEREGDIIMILIYLFIAIRRHLRCAHRRD